VKRGLRELGKERGREEDTERGRWEEQRGKRWVLEAPRGAREGGVHTELLATDADQDSDGGRGHLSNLPVLRSSGMLKRAPGQP